ncbi:hypothetical protein PODOV006v2_p0022 [Vibrio phage 15E36.1]|uniref:Uncharacterized protein n=1 Tax=Vibrio phage 15E36.1 TaxID=2859290 RepID=A0AAE7XVJ3_9CAUD|nr:hypothetical protein PODOV006v2_p0022 [Vibrio phage 15E36.1]
MAKYLPIHKKMRPCLKNGMGVIHNGGGTRQGFVGKIISTVGKEITIHFTGKNFNQKYSWDWFLENFHIDILVIEKMKGYFNGTGYLSKYRLFIITDKALAQRQRNQHKDNKALAEASEGGYTSVVADKNEQDPLDEVGEYICIAKGQVIGNVHKTQRIAELAASAYTEKNKCRVGILKVVADCNAKCVADIVRK